MRNLPGIYNLSIWQIELQLAWQEWVDPIMHWLIDKITVGITGGSVMDVIGMRYTELMRGIERGEH